MTLAALIDYLRTHENISLAYATEPILQARSPQTQSADPGQSSHSDPRNLGTLRQEEFQAGRRAATTVLCELGYPSPVTIQTGERGEPLWPYPDVRASISHTCSQTQTHSQSQGIAMCCGLRVPHASPEMNPSTCIRGLGLDIERLDRSISERAASRIFTEEERSSGALSMESALAIFSVKEAIYKAIYFASGTRLRFQDVSLRYVSQASFGRQFEIISLSERGEQAIESLQMYVVTQDGLLISLVLA